jgi:hypothetical protein
MQGALEAEPVAAQLPELAAFHACDAAAGQVKVRSGVREVIPDRPKVWLDFL